MNISRRNFLKNASLNTAILASIPVIVSSSISPDNKANRKGGIFADNDVVLFQGDSITDAGREKGQQLPNNVRAFGAGYAFIAASEMLNTLAERKLTIFNRGISGNKVFQLADRWQQDCLDLRPDVLSILIGVNDYWHKRNGQYDGTPEIYDHDYRELLTRTKKALPDVKLVLCEPYILTGAGTVDESWIEPFSRYQEIASQIAKDFDTIWIPLQKVFTEAAKIAPAAYWTADGVHPALAGCYLMAAAWLRTVGL